MKEKLIKVVDYVSKSNLPGVDFVINPYVGCPHSCKYCYACFMEKFTEHDKPWGNFLDVKICDKPINLKKLEGKSVFLSSVTDCYNPFEAKHKVTRKILEQLQNSNTEIVITTKSDLILRDLDILKKIPKISVASSINTLDEQFKNDMDKASSIKKRINMLKTMNENEIHTVLFMSPIFPYITDFKAIMQETETFIDEFWFENLKLRTPYKNIILAYIMKNYPQYYKEYIDIYVRHNNIYWKDLSKQIKDYCKIANLACSVFFKT